MVDGDRLYRRTDNPNAAKRRVDLQRDGRWYVWIGIQYTVGDIEGDVIVIL